MEFDFDTVRTNSQLNLLKTLLPFMDRNAQKFLSVYILVQELMLTVSFFENPRNHFTFYKDISSFYEKMIKDLPEEKRGMFDQMKGMMEAMEMMNAYQSMMNVDFGGDSSGETGNTAPSGENSPADDSPSETSGQDNTDFLSGFLTDEQKNLFQMFQSTMNGKDVCENE